MYKKIYASCAIALLLTMIVGLFVADNSKKMTIMSDVGASAESEAYLVLSTIPEEDQSLLFESEVAHMESELQAMSKEDQFLLFQNEVKRVECELHAMSKED